MQIIYSGKFFDTLHSEIRGGPIALRIITFGMSASKDSDLVRFLVDVKNREINTEILFGLPRRASSDVSREHRAGAEMRLGLFARRFNWAKFRWTDDTHVKLFLFVHHTRKVRAIVGSKNFGDSGMEDISILFGGPAARELNSYFHKAWQRAIDYSPRPLDKEWRDWIVEEEV